MRVIDLFCGCGGLSLGLQQSGYEIVAAFDNWEPAIDIYRKNFKHPIFQTDLSTINELEIKKMKSLNVDMVVGGPPCQDYSSAGKRDETLGRADLTVSYSEIINRIKPKYFIMENVDLITKSDRLKHAIDTFHKAGYGLTSKVLDASYCGAPQKRKRFFLIGELNGKDGFLDYYLTKNLSSTPMTIRQYLGNDLGIDFYYRHPRSYNRRGVFSIDEPSPTIRGVNRPIPPNYKKHEGDPVDVKEGVRPLTTIERSYIQTFPKSFVFEGTKTNLEQMIGNAVPVNLAKYVGDCLNEYIKDELKGVIQEDGQLAFFL